jgi:hypothetical protein
MKYLEALPQLTQGKGTTIFLPAEAAGVMGALGGMKELLVRSASDLPAAARAPGSPPPPRIPQPIITPAYVPPPIPDSDDK